MSRTALSKLEFLSIFTPVNTQGINWQWGELFRHFTEVTTVQVHGHGTTGLLQALTPPQHSRGKGYKRRRGDKDGDAREHTSNNSNNNRVAAPVQVPIFPKLTSLLLETLDFNNMVPGSGVLYDLALSTVNWRKAKKAPLSMLCITRCAISAEKAAALEKIVRDFQWDYDEGNEYQDEYDDYADDDNDDDDDGSFDYDDESFDIADLGVQWGRGLRWAGGKWVPVEA
jgi:hypothetical protein